MHRSVAVTRERGRWLRRGDDLRVLVTLHPSALLRLPGEEREAAYARWLGDLRHAGEVVDAWNLSPLRGRRRSVT